MSMRYCGKTVIGLIVLLGSAWVASSHAQTFPERMVRIVVPYAVGTAPDITVRLLADRLTQMWKQPVTVDNRSGAAGAVGAVEVKRSKPDGHDWFIGDTGSMVTSPMLVKDLPFDPEKDFIPVTQLTKIFFYIWTGTGSPFKTVGELIAAAKANPGKLIFGSNGVGSPQHFGWETLRVKAGIDMLHVPFKGGPAIITATAAGEIQGLMAGYNVIRPMVEAGKIRPLAVISKVRDPQHPEIPTLAESGGPADFESSPWTAVVVLAATPRATINKIHDDVVQVLNRPDVKERLLQSGNIVVGDRPEEVAALIRAEREQFRDIAATMRARGDF